jgi:hypothetical protein
VSADRAQTPSGGRALAGRLGLPGIVAAAVLAPLAWHWLSGRTLVWFDTASLYAPQRWIVDEALRAFRLPLWNPYMGAGVPFLADAIHGVLHPVSVLTAWLGTGRSADLLIGGYLTCAGVGAALLARDLGASRAAAALAGIVFALSGHVLSMAGNLVFIAGAGSLPFCVVGLRRFAVRPGPATLAGGVAGTAVLVLSGEYQAVMVAGGISLVLAADVAGWRGALRASGAGALGLLLAGAQLVPSAFHVARSVRNPLTWAPDPTIWPFLPWRMGELVVPGFLRGSNPLIDRVFEALAQGSWIPGNTPMPFVASVAVGLLPLTLALAGVRTGRRGAILGGLALLFLWAALGPALGASEILGRVPVWRGFQFAEKLVEPLSLVLALLAALGADSLSERRLRGGMVLAVAAVLAVASLAVLALVSAELEGPLREGAHERILRGAWHVLASFAALAAWLAGRERLGAARLPALAALAWIGLVAASPAALYPGDPVARLGTPGPAVEAEPPGARVLVPNTYEAFSLQRGAVLLDEAIQEHAMKAYPAHNVADRLDSLEVYGAMPSRGLHLVKVAFGARWPEAARRYAVTHVVVSRPRSSRDKAAFEIATRGGVRVNAGDGPGQVWSVPHRPWASFPPEVRVVPSADAAGAAVAAAFIEGSQAAVVESKDPLPAAPGRVLYIARALESVRVEAEAAGDATLVVADSWWPGWEATLDGTPVPILRADVLVRAIRWPAGRHVLEMRYRPPEVGYGLLASALGAALTAASMAFLARRPKELARPEGG